MNKKSLLIPLMVVPFIASCGGNNTKPNWKEISRADAIRLEAKILSNFKAPKFYSSKLIAKSGDKTFYTNEGEGYSERKCFIEPLNLYVVAVLAIISMLPFLE